jgi:hypothetical protein
MWGYPFALFRAEERSIFWVLQIGAVWHLYGARV